MINKKYLLKLKYTAAAVMMAAILMMGTGCGNDSIMPANPVTPGVVTEEVPGEEEAEEVSNAPEFSFVSGFYDEEFSLEINCPDDKAVIYYTTDGTAPDENSTVYEGAIDIKSREKDANILSALTGVNPDENYKPDFKVDKATVIRAVAKLSDGTMTDIASGTYFVGIDREAKYGTLPIISMFTDSDNLFDYDKGIFVMGKTYDDWIKESPGNKYKDGWESKGNYSNKGRNWEREATIEYIPNDGSEGFVQDVGIRVSGAASRSATQKSIRILAREDYGKKSIKYNLIPGNMRSDGDGEVTKYKSIVLRNGGNDNSFAKVRDPYLQGLAINRSFDILEATPCVLFIDGEYWGMYALTEDYSDNYIENNYGIDNDNVIYIKRGEIEDGEDSDIKYYDDMFNYIVGNDMSVSENYEKAESMLDMQGFMEYCAFNIYINNEDSFFKDNNWAMWRVRQTDGENAYADGKWRMLCYDTDFSTGIYDQGGKYKTNNLKDLVQRNLSKEDNLRPKDLLTSLLKNDEFKKEFVLTLCDMRNVDFEAVHAEEELDKIKALYDMNTADTISRFGPDWIVRWNDPQTYFDEQVGYLSNYMSGRYDNFMSHISIAFEDYTATDVKITFEGGENGTVYINKTLLGTDSEFNGEYLSSYPITITLIPNSGKTGSISVASGAEITDTYKDKAGNDVYEVTLSSTTEINVEFK